MRHILILPFLIAALLHLENTNAQNYVDAWTTDSSGTVNALRFNSQGHLLAVLSTSQASSFNGSALPYPGHRHLISMTSTGIVDWVQPLGSYYFGIETEVVLDGYDNIYFAGVYDGSASHVGDTSFTSNTANNFISKFSSNGDLLWVKTFGSGLVIRSIDRATNGDLIVGGSTRMGFTPVIGGDTIAVFGNLGTDIILVKFDANGDPLWYDQSGGPGFYTDHCREVVFDSNDNVVMTGWFRSDSQFDTIFMPDQTSTNFNGFVASYSPTGHAQWVTRLGYEPSGISADALGNTYIVGLSYYLSDSALISGSPNALHYLAKVSGSGDIIWIVKPNDTNWGNATDVSTDASGNSWVVGFHRDSLSIGPFNKAASGLNSLMVYKADPNGTIEWMDLQGSSGTQSDFRPAAIAHNDGCGLMVSGYYNLSSGWSEGSATLPATISTAPFLISMDDCGLTTLIQENPSVGEILLYPNPAVNVLHVQGVDGSAQISILDLLGRPIAVQIHCTSGSWEVNVSNLPSGSYIIRVQTNTGPLARLFQVQ